jgi:SnoaL-like domain
MGYSPDTGRGAMGVSREMATAFVEGYGAAWESWDFARFVDLLSDDVIYVEHPVDEMVIGSEEMARYIRKEQSEQGAADVRMGRPIVDGDHDMTASHLHIGTSCA